MVQISARQLTDRDSQTPAMMQSIETLRISDHAYSIALSAKKYDKKITFSDAALNELAVKACPARFARYDGSGVPR